MKREDMVCANCLNFDPETETGRMIEVIGHPADSCQEPACRLHPQPYLFLDSPYTPIRHWCAQGVWRERHDRYQEWVEYRWGEWEDN